MASSGSFSFGCSAAVPLLPTPSFSFPSQPAASSFPFTNDPAPTPCRHAPVHPATSPSEVSQAPVPAGFAPVLPSASPQEALPKAPVPAGSAPVRPSASQGPCAFWVCPCAAQCSPCGCLSLGPCAWWVCPCAPRRSSGRSFLSRSYFGHTGPAPCARPLTGPCPASDHAFPSDLASSASPSVCAPARSPEGLFCSWTCASLAPNSCCPAHSGACCRPWWCLHPRAALLPARGIFQPTAMGNALRTRSVRASIQTVCLHFKAMTSLR